MFFDKTLDCHKVSPQPSVYFFSGYKWTANTGKAVLSAAIILVTTASGKNIWELKFWGKSAIGNQQINKRNLLEKLSIIR